MTSYWTDREFSWQPSVLEILILGRTCQPRASQALWATTLGRTFEDWLLLGVEERPEAMWAPAPIGFLETVRTALLPRDHPYVRYRMECTLTQSTGAELSPDDVPKTGGKPPGDRFIPASQRPYLPILHDDYGTLA
jgi:hypothetical protein